MAAGTQYFVWFLLPFFRLLLTFSLVHMMIYVLTPVLF